MRAAQALTSDQKRQLCELKKKAPASTQVQLIQYAKENFGVTPSPTAIYRLLKTKDTWLNIKQTVPTKRQRPAKWPRLETALDAWFHQMLGEGAKISGAAIIEKGKELATELKIRDFGGSAGWLSKFKARHMIQEKPIHGEASDASSVGIRLAEEMLPTPVIEEQGLAEDTEDARIDLSDPNECAPLIISLAEAQQAADRLAIFMRAHPQMFSVDMLLLFQREFCDRITSMTLVNSSRQRQRSIVSFFRRTVHSNSSAS